MALGILMAFTCFVVIGTFVLGAYQTHRNADPKDATKAIRLIFLIMVIAFILAWVFR
jgi:hypothetical protein